MVGVPEASAGLAKHLLLGLKPPFLGHYAAPEGTTHYPRNREKPTHQKRRMRHPNTSFGSDSKLDALEDF